MWWPGSGLGQCSRDDCDVSNELDSGFCEDRCKPVVQEAPQCVADCQPARLPSRQQDRSAKKSPLKSRPVARCRKDMSNPLQRDWTEQLKDIGSLTVPSEANQPVKKATSTFQRIKAFPRKLHQEIVKAQPRHRGKVPCTDAAECAGWDSAHTSTSAGWDSAPTSPNAPAGAGLAGNWATSLHQNASNPQSPKTPIGATAWQDQCSTAGTPLPLPVTEQIGSHATLGDPKESAPRQAPAEEETCAELLSFLHTKQVSRRDSAASCASIGNFLGDHQDHTKMQRRRPQALTHMHDEDLAGEQSSSSSQSPTSTRSARSHFSEMSSEDETFGPSVKRGRKMNSKAAKYMVDESAVDSSGYDGSTCLGAPKCVKTLPISKCSSRLTSNRSSIHEALPEGVSGANTRLTSNRSSIHEVLLDDIPDCMPANGGMLSGEALAALFNADGELIPARWTPSIVNGSSGFNSGINTTRHSFSEMLSKQSSRRSSHHSYMSRRSSHHSEREGYPEGPLSEVQEEPGVERSILEEEELNGQPSEEEEDTCDTEKVHRRPSSPSDSWEEWRTDFPLEILDKLAEFFEAAPGDAQGHREMSLKALDDLLLSKLGFPPKVVSAEAELKGLIFAGAAVEKLTFSSLPHFLDLIRGAVKRVQDDSTRCLWSKEDDSSGLLPQGCPPYNLIA